MKRIILLLSVIFSFCAVALPVYGQVVVGNYTATSFQSGAVLPSSCTGSSIFTVTTTWQPYYCNGETYTVFGSGVLPPGWTCTGTGASQVCTAPGTLAAQTVTISGTPTNPTDAATVDYVDTHSGFHNGFLEQCGVGNNTGGFACLGNALSHGGASAAQVGSTANSPYMNQSTSAVTAGAYSGWYGQKNIWGTFAPDSKFGVAYGASTDYSANSRQWFGFMIGSCLPATMAASDTPACAYGAIRWSTTASDTTYRCVTDNGSGTPTVTAIGTQTPSTLGASQYLIPMEIAWTSASAFTCTVNGVSVTNTTTLPGTTNAYQELFINTYPGGGVTHVELDGTYGVCLAAGGCG